MTAQYEKQILTLAKICVADQVARNPSQRDPDFVLEDATKAIEYMENHPRYMTHSPSYGDNATCDVCHDVFDARNTDHDIFNNNWICGKCLDYDDEELAEKLGVEESVITEARS